MAWKVVFVCAFAIMVQSIAGTSCYGPPSQTNYGCGVSGGSVTVASAPVVTSSSCRSSTSSLGSIGVSAPIRSSGAIIGSSPSIRGSGALIGSSSLTGSGAIIGSSPISSSCVSIDIPQSGGPLTVTSIGPITPTGIAVATDLSLGGDLVVSGALPYLTAVAFEGQFATEGIVPVSYGCGDVVGITEQLGGIAGGVSGISGSVLGRSGSAGVINSGYSGYASGSGCGCYC